MSNFRQYGMTKKELMDDDIITFGNGLPNDNLLTFYRFKLKDDSNPKSLVYNLEFNEQIMRVISEG